MAHAILASGIVLFILVFVILRQFWLKLPDISDPQAFIAQESIRITDRNGHELYRIIGEQDRTWIHIDEVPEHVPQAFIAIEDKRLYTRSCVDIRALARAVVANTKEFGSEGGSTITQQLVRTVFLSPEKSIDRKIREILLACQLEAKHSKDEILELYLNWIAFGHGISGIEQASQFYFGISAQHISVAQAATLAALPQRPTHFSPYGRQKYVTIHDELKQKLRSGSMMSADQIAQHDILLGLIGRRTRMNKRPFIIGGRANEVVRKMAQQGFITNELAMQAHHQIVDMQFADQGYRIVAPHFVFWIQQQIQGSGNQEIRTTLDVPHQQLAEQIIASHYDIVRAAGAKHVALLALDASTNQVLAYKGNTGYLHDDAGQVDMVQAPRQPGSSFKPFVYATAFAAGHSPYEIVVDEPMSLGSYQPKNYDGGYLWRMPMAVALAKSRNIPAIKTFFLAGGENPVLRTAAALGAQTPFAAKVLADREEVTIRFGWPLALGAVETPLFEMVNAYSTIANGGWYRPIQPILYTIQRNNEQINSSYGKHEYRAIPEHVAQDISNALSSVDNRPEGGWQEAMDTGDIHAAIKTGTSNIGSLPRDTWTIGYTEDLILGVWVGNADGTPLKKGANGLEVALPIWKNFLLNKYNLAL